MLKNPDPVIDIMAVNAVESLFHEPPFDPWGREIAVKMIDMIIYSDRVLYPIVRPKKFDVGEEHKATPTLLNTLKKSDSKLIDEVPYYIEDYLEYNSNELVSTFEAFEAYVLANRTLVRQYIVARRAEWIRPQYTARLPKHYVFPIQKVKELQRFQHLQTQLNVDEDELVYVFDLVLRYTLYGGIAAEGAYYLSHPLREDVDVPTLERRAAIPPYIPLPLGPHVVKLVKSLTRDEFAALLHEAHGVVRELHIDKLKPGTVGKDARRELAERLALPARLKGFSSKAVNAIGGMTAITSNAPLLVAQNELTGIVAASGAVLGGAISASSSLWQAQLPRWASVPWLRWAMNYDVEREEQEG